MFCIAMRRITPLRRAIFESRRTQAEIAREVGIDPGHMSKIANGLHAPEPTRQKIADALGRTITDLWPEDDEQGQAA